MKAKLCWYCGHFTYRNAETDWSEVTPGCSFSIGCCNGRWSFDAYYDTREEFQKCLETAETCRDFQLLAEVAAAEEAARAEAAAALPELDAEIEKRIKRGD